MPKRLSDSSNDGAAPAKKAKSSTKKTAAGKGGNRWKAVSASRNIDAEYKKMTEDPAQAYKYICICQAPFRDDDEDSDENDEEEDHEDGGNGPRCGTKSCICQKDADKHPGHSWIVTYAGFRKFVTARTMIGFRDPDSFGMYTYNDHASYGVIEVVENLLLDFLEAEDNWKEQWSICEAAVFLRLCPAADLMGMCDDGERVNVVEALIARMFLTMLAKLEGLGLLAEGSEVRNLGVIMGTYFKLAECMREYDMSSDSVVTSAKGKSKTKGAQPVIFNGAHSDDPIATYAKKHGIKVRGPKDVDELLAERDAGKPLPSSGTETSDAWGFRPAFTAYKTSHGPKIGGDHLDITTWSSADRKAAAFDGRDPIDKKMIAALKEGLVMAEG